jgi:predicted metal-dependent peptidase
MSAENRVVAARTALVLEQPFFGSLILGLKMVPSKRFPTMAVDGRSIFYNPAFVDAISYDELIGTLIHEVEHVALGHPWRRDLRDHRGWNIACDLAINGDIRKDGFKLPAGVLYPDKEQEGKSAEWIFERLPQQQQQQGQSQQKGDGKSGDSRAQGGSHGGGGDSCSHGPFDDVLDAPTDSDEDGDPPPNEQEWKDRVMVAMTQAKLQGNMPGCMERMVEQAMRPRLDLRSLLLRFFTERAASDYTWMKPNSRYAAQGLYLPGLHEHSLGEVAVMVDTSGSVDDVSLQYARGILESVIDECHPAGVTLYFVDTEVAHVERLEKGDPLTWTPKGGGGTDFRSFFAQVDKGEIEPACVVCITDLYATFPEELPAIPTMWLSTTPDREAPFGETVYIDR